MIQFSFFFPIASVEKLTAKGRGFSRDDEYIGHLQMYASNKKKKKENRISLNLLAALVRENFRLLQSIFIGFKNGDEDKISTFVAIKGK